MTKNITFELPEELVKSFTELAEAENLSANELAQVIISGYVAGQTLPPSDEELAAVEVTIKKSKLAGAKSYSDKELDDILNNYKPKTEGL